MAFQLSEMPFAEKTGAPAFRSLAVMRKVLESLRGGLPLSVTTTVTEFVTGPAAPDGVQLKAPLVELMVASIGELVRLKVRVWTGMSLSAALKFNASRWPFNANTLLTVFR